jgi:hypothetical protein
MASPQNKTEQKYGISPQAGKDNKTQAEKDKQQAAQKHDEKKDASGKPTAKSGGCN